MVSSGKKHQIPCVIMKGEEIERVNETKLLGVIISDNPKWRCLCKYLIINNVPK